MRVDDIARHLDARVESDISPFQQRVRVLQAIWRDEQGYPCGEHKSRGETRALGSSLPMPWAKESLANFLTPGIRDVVRSEVCDRRRSRGKMYRPPFFYDLLSNQALCFNIFAELHRDLPLASDTIAALSGGRFVEVRSIEFEYSPGRGERRYTADRSAFDVFLECTTASGGRGFIGIDVLYRGGNLQHPSGKHHPRYDEIEARMGCFDRHAREQLRAAPLQHIWRDHLLTGITRLVNGYDDALFVLLFPKDNPHCREATSAYRECLTEDGSFDSWTLETLAAQLLRESEASWVNLWVDRYLAFEKIRRRLRQLAADAIR